MTSTPERLLALNDARRELATVYSAFFSGVSTQSELEAAEQHFVIEWARYHNLKPTILLSTKTNSCPR